MGCSVVEGEGSAAPAGDDHAWAPPNHATSPEDPTDLLPGLDQVEQIARGADSVVYRARQRALNRLVAVKVLLVDDPATIARFERELELTVRLGHQHPHIVTVLDSGFTATGQPCIVMEYVERGSLGDLLKVTGPLPSADVLRIGRTIADALTFAHDQGVLHRDVKPQNILILPTSWVLADFGISRLADSDSTASVEQFSYRHAAPQVLDGFAPTEADDLWSLGSTLHTLLDGRPPFASDDPGDDTALAYLRRARTESPRPLVRPDAPAGLVEAIERCLVKDPAGRWRSAAALAQALARVELESQDWAPTSPSSSPSDATPAVTAEPVQAPTAPNEPVTTQSAATRTAATETAVTETAVMQRATTDAAATSEAAAPETSDAAAPVPSSPPTVAPARSALAHSRPVPDVDQTPTGHLPPAVDDGLDGHDGPTPVDETRTRRSDDGPRGPVSRRLIAGGLVLGVGLGVAVALWGSSIGRKPGNPSATPTSNAVPSVSLPPSLSPSPEVPVSVPSLAPLVLDARGRGTSVDLEWSDPTGGTATFVVIQTNQPEPIVVAQFPPGTTKGTIEGVDPTAEQVCYTIGAIVGAERGISTERCVDPSP